MSRLSINRKRMGMEVPLPGEHHFRNLNLLSLIQQFSLIEEQFQLNSLKTEFYRRFHLKFFDRCHKITHRLYGKNPDWELVRDDVFQETFLTAFEKIGNFYVQPSWNDQECEKVILFWLAKIANNKLLNLVKTDTREKENLESYLPYCQSENAEGSVAKRNYTPSYDKTKFDAVWSYLNPMSREILLLCLNYDTLDEQNQKHLPDHVLQAICTKYRVTVAAVRQAKRRALIAIKSCKINQ